MLQSNPALKVKNSKVKGKKAPYCMRGFFKL